MKKLQWDSTFWGVDIFHLDKLSSLDFEKITSPYYLVQAIPNIGDLDFIHGLEKKEFTFKECKVILQKKKLDVINEENVNFKEITLIDLQPYQNIFFELFGENTRYDIFPKHKVNDFYYTWMVNSIAGTMDDACIGYYIDNQLAGFITYRIRKPIITIGLLGVLPEFQGRGISQLLLAYVDNVAFNKAINTIEISTQGKNINALNAYIKNGYRISSIDHWYYFKEEVK